MEYLQVKQLNDNIKKKLSLVYKLHFNGWLQKSPGILLKRTANCQAFNF